MTRIEIHYQSPASDPLKVPRPHFVDLDEDGKAVTRGGEVGDVNLIGFAKNVKPGIRGSEYRMPDFAFAEQLYRGDVKPEELAGYYAQFSERGGIFGYNVPIERVEVIP